MQPAFLASLAALPLILSPAPAPVAASPAAPPDTYQHPNILLIVIDDVGTENFSFWPTGPTLPPHAVTTAYTPRLAALAASGMVFTKCYVQPLCAPSRSCLTTGRYAFETGMGANPLSTGGNPDLSTWNSIPDVLHQGTALNTYKCGAFGKWHMGDFGAMDYTDPIQAGYDKFVGTEANVPPVPNGHHYDWERITAPSGSLPYRLDHVPPVGSPIVYDETTYSSSWTRRAAISWINNQTGSYFAYVCFNAPHGPFQVPPYSLLSTTSANNALTNGLLEGDLPATPAERVPIYQLALEATDTEIGRLLDAIDLTNTTVIVVGDNGTAELAVQQPYVPLQVKGSVYDAGTRVPLIVSSPLIPTQFQGSTCDRLVGAVDFRPTISDIASAVPPAEPTPIPGRSFLSLIQNPAAAPIRATAYSEIFKPLGPYNPVLGPVNKTEHARGITDGVYHYLRIFRGPGSYREEAYDLSIDPLETYDLLAPGVIMTWNQGQAIQALSAALTQLSGP